MFEGIRNTWASIKLWFKNSQTIFLARIEAAVGFTVVALSVADWSPLISAGIDTGLTWAQATFIGGVMAVKGLITEWSRRMGTREVAGHLLPSTVTVAQAEAVVEIGKVEAKAASEGEW